MGWSNFDLVPANTALRFIFFLGAAVCAVPILMLLYAVVLKLISKLPDGVTTSIRFKLVGVAAVIGLIVSGFVWLID